MKEFREAFRPCTTIVLKENFRNPGPVYELASAVVSKNRERFQKDIRTVKSTGAKPLLYIFKTPQEEARFIATEIRKLTGGTGYHDLSSVPHRSPSEFAILVRTKQLIPPIRQALQNVGLPVFCLDDEIEKRRREIAGIITFVENLSPQTVDIDRLKDETLKRATDTALEDYLEGIFFGIRAMQGPEAVKKLKEALVFLSQEPLSGPAHEAVQVMTLHASKGLEFPVVFIAGCEKGLLPLDLEGLTTEFDEERRLLYVGMTRATERLIMTCAQRRDLFGRRFKTGPSPFLRGLEPLYETKRPVEKTKRIYQKGLF